MVRVKICGVTSLADALACVAAGADAIGVNFALGSPRRVSVETAREIVSLLPAHVIGVGVFVDMPEAELREVVAGAGLGCLQLHGDEPPELVRAFLPHAYKGIRLRGRESLALAERYPGEHILVDAYVPGVAGGTGEICDWSLAAELARSRKLTLAGGLTAENVAMAVRGVRPYCVDVASGVESAPGKKDYAKLRAFVHEAKQA